MVKFCELNTRLFGKSTREAGIGSLLGADIKALEFLSGSL